MQKILEKHIDRENPHHFYIFQGDSVATVEIKDYFEKSFKEQLEQVLTFNFDNLLIENGRDLINIASRKVAKGKKRLFIVQTGGIHLNTQNALLKILEEPTSGLHFVFVVDNPGLLLPTFKSRAFLIDADLRSDNQDFQNILKMDYAERLGFVTKLLEEIKDGKKSKTEVLTLLKSAIKFLRQDDLKKHFKTVNKLLKFEQYFELSSPNLKAILEFLMLALPRK